MPVRTGSFPVPLVALALSAFAIGTAEFVSMGLLPQVADNLRVSIPAAGWLVSGYALADFASLPRDRLQPAIQAS